MADARDVELCNPSRFWTWCPHDDAGKRDLK